MSPDDQDRQDKEGLLDKIPLDLRRKALVEIEASGRAARFKETPKELLTIATRSAIQGLNVQLGPHRSPEPLQTQKKLQDEFILGCYTTMGVSDNTASEIIQALIQKLRLISRTRH